MLLFASLVLSAHRPPPPRDDPSFKLPELHDPFPQETPAPLPHEDRLKLPELKQP